ncbi:MAG: CRISPR-associated protein Cas5, partial [candidate division WOR-3 bacterium]
MKVLRIKLYQPVANYRPHYSMQVRHSYPLPPPSAVIGLIHRVLGMKPGSTYRDEGETIKGIDVAILGRYSGIGWDYQWLLSPQVKGDRNILF